MNSLKTIADLLPIPSFKTIILCFFFPFMLIKCGDTTLLSVTGKDLITGMSKEKLTEKMSGGEKENAMLTEIEPQKSVTKDNYSPLDSRENGPKRTLSPNFLMIITLLAAVLGLLFFFLKSVKNKPLFYLIFAAVGFAGLMIFYINAQDFLNSLGMNDLSQPGSGLFKNISVSTEMGTAFYLSIIINALLILFYGYILHVKKQNATSPQTVNL